MAVERFDNIEPNAVPPKSPVSLHLVPRTTFLDRGQFDRILRNNPPGMLTEDERTDLATIRSLRIWNATADISTNRVANNAAENILGVIVTEFGDEERYPRSFWQNLFLEGTRFNSIRATGDRELRQYVRRREELKRMLHENVLDDNNKLTQLIEVEVLGSKLILASPQAYQLT